MQIEPNGRGVLRSVSEKPVICPGGRFSQPGGGSLRKPAGGGASQTIMISAMGLESAIRTNRKPLAKQLIVGRRDHGIVCELQPKHFTLGLVLGQTRPRASDVTGPSRHLACETGVISDHGAATAEHSTDGSGH